MYKQFDLVKIRTTKNVEYLSAPRIVADPNSIWSIVGFIGDSILINSGATLIRIPFEDIVLYAEYQCPGG